MKAPQYVYAVRFGPYVKIGISENPRRRLWQLGFTNQIQPPDVRSYPAEPVFAVEASLDVEKLLHAIFEPYRVMGEWFSSDALPWVDGLLAGSDVWRRQFSIEPPAKEKPAPDLCVCYYACQFCALSNVDWHAHSDEPCPEHPDALVGA